MDFQATENWFGSCSTAVWLIKRSFNINIQCSFLSRMKMYWIWSQFYSDHSEQHKCVKPAVFGCATRQHTSSLFCFFFFICLPGAGKQLLGALPLPSGLEHSPFCFFTFIGLLYDHSWHWWCHSSSSDLSGTWFSQEPEFYVPNETIFDWKAHNFQKFPKLFSVSLKRHFS